MRAVHLVIFSGLFLGCQAEKPVVIPDNYQTWESPTLATINYETPGNGTRLRKIYVNERGLHPVKIDSGIKFEVGSVIVRDLYPSSEPSPNEKVLVTTFMIKAPDDSRSRGGWIWGTINRKTGIQSINTGDFCITCHDNANESHPYLDQNVNNEFRDFVFAIPEEKI